MLGHILWWIFRCLLCFLFSCCARRGAVRGWAELSTAGAAVTRSPAAGQRLLIKLLPDDFITSMRYMASVTLLYFFFMTSSLFCSLGELTFSGVPSTTSVYQQADVQCLQLSAPLQPDALLCAHLRLDSPRYHQHRRELSHLQLYTLRQGLRLGRYSPSLAKLRVHTLPTKGNRY